MYLVDTSVWIHALRPYGSSEIQARLRPLIIGGNTAVTEWILLELMTGLTKTEQPSAFLQWFDPIPRLRFSEEWWETAWSNAARLRKRGVSPSAADCLIATVAIKHGVSLIHCDSDFESMVGSLPLHTIDWTNSVRST